MNGTKVYPSWATHVYVDTQTCREQRRWKSEFWCEEGCVCVGHLEHKSTHAEDHAEQVHVVRRGVLQCRVGLCAGRFVPVTTQTYFNQRQLKGKRTVSWSLLKSLVLSLYK